MDWQRGRLLRSCVLVLSTMQNYVSIMRLLCFLAKVSHTTCILFATLDTMYRYNVIWLFKVTLVLMWVFFLKKKQLCFCFKKSFIVLSFAFFFSFVHVHSILLSCSSCMSMVPRSPCSLYVSFLVCLRSSFFLVFYALWKSCQKGEKFDIWMSFLKRSNKFRGRTWC